MQDLTPFPLFRDNHLLTTVDGRKMVETYYSIAPEISQKLNKEADLETVWVAVCKCVFFIESHQYKQAIKTYKSMVETMQNKLA